MASRTTAASGRGGERGIALVTTLLIMMLMSALMVGFSAAVMNDQRYRSLDKDRIRAFYAAQSGLEKLSADLAGLFFSNVAPSTAQIAALGEEEDEPVIDGVTFTKGSGDDADAYAAVPLPTEPGVEPWGQISSGPYQGLIALKKSYRLDSAVRTSTGGEAHVTRFVDTVAIPVFQFGIFSDVDLSFHAGPNFQFGGRIHTNANLFLAHGNGATLTIPEKVTAVGEVVREYLVNGRRVDVSTHEGTVSMARAPGSYRAMGIEEGSVVDSIGSAPNSRWTNISLTNYNGYIRNWRTGAKTLNLPVITLGGANVDIARRPIPNEDTTNPTLLGERYFTKVSLRILLSDTANDISSLPGVTATPPVSLENWQTTPPAGYVVGAGRPPVARAVGRVVDGAGNPVVPTLNGAVAAGVDRTITLDANVPASYRHKSLRVISAGGVDLGALTCTGKRQGAFTGCSGLGSIASGSTITGAIDLVEGNNQPVSTSVTANWNGSAATDVLVTSTMAFASNTFWVRNTDNDENVLVTCRGYTATNAFRECNVTATLDDNAQILSQSVVPRGTGTIGGFLKIEMQDTDKVWRDVTAEFLDYGIAGPDLTGRCADPTPNAIIRLQRLRDNTEPAGQCSYAGSTTSGDYWPNTIFDAREGLFRNAIPAADARRVRLGGVMHYVMIDARNLSAWFAGTGAYAAGTGRQALSINGYAVYFSDRRNNRDGGSRETGELGFEDNINPAVAGGAPNNSRDEGEDVNGNNELETYGQFPSFNGARNAVVAGSLAPLTAAARLTDNIQRGIARSIARSSSAAR
jgi:Tfp pilus assembly protein PilX